jgi:hypothetical protein
VISGGFIIILFFINRKISKICNEYLISIKKGGKNVKFNEFDK